MLNKLFKESTKKKNLFVAITTIKNNDHDLVFISQITTPQVFVNKNFKRTLEIRIKVKILD